MPYMDNMSTWMPDMGYTSEADMYEPAVNCDEYGCAAPSSMYVGGGYMPGGGRAQRKCPAQRGSCIFSASSSLNVLEACASAGGKVVKPMTCSRMNWLATLSGSLDDAFPSDDRCARVPTPPDNRTVADFFDAWAVPCCGGGPHICDPVPAPSPQVQQNQAEIIEVQVYEVQGSMSLSLADSTEEEAQAFVDDPEVQSTLQSSIATTAGVSADAVTLTLTVVQGTGGRRLQDVSVLVEYTIEVESVEAASTLSTAIQAVPAATMAAQVNEDLAANDAIGTNIVVAGVSVIGAPSTETRTEMRPNPEWEGDADSGSWRSASISALAAFALAGRLA